MNRMLILLHAFLVFLCTPPETYSQLRKHTAFDTSQVRTQPKSRTTSFFSKTQRPLQTLTQSGSMRSGDQVKTVRRGNNNLSVFGFDLFSEENAPVAWESSEVLSLPANYKLGPGDRLGIYLLGTVQENIDVMVNVEGKIFVPPVGVIDVQGLGLAEFRALLNRRLSKYYDNFTLDIMLLQPKQVMVAVVGDVMRPGKYVLSSLNTVLDAVVTAGGPTGRGSIRDVRLVRQDSLVASVDLYRFLMTGENSDDEFLQAGDRIQVPVARSKVVVDGEVSRPAIFELTPGGQESLADVLELAGGLTDLAYLDKVEVSRMTESGYRSVQYIDYSSASGSQSAQAFSLRNEDEVYIYSKLEQIHERKVAIFGEIRKPGAYELEDNMHLSDLILKAGNLTRKAYRLEAEVAKVDPGQPTRILKVNLGDMDTSSGHNGFGGDSRTDIALEEDDQVFVRRIPEWEVGLMVEVRGEARFPGHYSIVKDSTYLSDVLSKAGGFTDEAFLQEAFVIRPSTRVRFDKEFERLREMKREEMSELEYQYFVMRQNSADVDQIVVNFEKLVNQGDASQDVILEGGDVIVIPRAPRVVTVTGSVAKPGGVTYKASAPLSYYLAKAGGASWDAKLSKTKIVKVTGEVLDDEDVASFEAGDIIWVPRKSDKKFWPVALQTISVFTQLASIYLIVDTAINR